VRLCAEPEEHAGIGKQAHEPREDGGADPTPDQQRRAGGEVEAVAERPEHLHRAGPGERARARAADVEQERELVVVGPGRRDGPREVRVRRRRVGAQHEELPGHTGVGPVALQPKERVRAAGLDVADGQATRRREHP
jgi:hypothetical protein